MTISIEAMLLGWSESHSGGCKIVLQVAPEDLDHFRSMTVAKGKLAGQRLALAFVEIGDDEQPVEQPAERKRGAGPLAQLAGRWCGDPAFQHWIVEAFPGIVPTGLAHDPVGLAACIVRDVCGVSSRAELDTNPNAGRSFHIMIRQPFAQWMEERAAKN